MKTDSGFYLWMNSEQSGPYSLDEIVNLRKRGKVSQGTPYRAGEEREWDVLGTIWGAIDDGQGTPPVIAQVPPRHGPVLTVFAVLFGVAGIILLIGALGVMFQSPEQRAQSAASDRKVDAYYTATEFVRQQYPGAQKFSDYRDSVVEQDGSTYRVAITVDGLNSFGGPIRKTVGVELEQNGGGWRLVSVAQR